MKKSDVSRDEVAERMRISNQKAEALDREVTWKLELVEREPSGSQDAEDYLAIPWQRVLYYGLKRAIDIIGSVIAFILFWPLILAVALAVKLDSPGPAIFSQKRVGYDWRTGCTSVFTMHKFRSMRFNCDDTIHKQLIKDLVNASDQSRVADSHLRLVKLTKDPRVTAVGRFIRKTSLDELPQFWNVLRGQMSLVGPRPVPIYEVAEYKPEQRMRLAAKPGITGLWQINGRGATTIDGMVSFDLVYIQRQSFLFDLEILFLTVPRVLSRRGAV